MKQSADATQTRSNGSRDPTDEPSLRTISGPRIFRRGKSSAVTRNPTKPCALACTAHTCPPSGQSISQATLDSRSTDRASESSPIETSGTRGLVLRLTQIRELRSFQLKTSRPKRRLRNRSSLGPSRRSSDAHRSALSKHLHPATMLQPTATKSGSACGL